MRRDIVPDDISEKREFLVFCHININEIKLFVISSTCDSDVIVFFSRVYVSIQSYSTLSFCLIFIINDPLR